MARTSPDERASVPETPVFDADLQIARSKVLSATRLKLAFTLFVLTLLLGLSALTFAMVSNIFDQLTPSTRHDLEWKTRRGVLELAQTSQLGMVVGKTERVREAVEDYVSDDDVLVVTIRDAEGETVFEYRKPAADGITQAELFAGPPGTTHETKDAFRAWASSEIEGTMVGEVALMVSKKRLAAGHQLREDILRAAAAGALVALVLAMAFVNLYIGPILRTTSLAFEKLERTTEAALAATRLKSEFLANMSHEIRTPMNGIIGMIDLFRRTPMSAKQRRYIQTMEGSARSLLTIIDDILDFSKLEAGKYDVRNEDLEVRQVLQEVSELLAPKAHAKGIELVQRIEADVPFSIIGDVDRIKQVLTNLVSNAIKFTDVGHVVVRVSRTPASSRESDGEALILRFEVVDTGAGIAPEHQSRLFEMFSQVDGSSTRKHGGTGLGLAISKRLAEAMGGEVGVESLLGEGSTFWFSIATRKGSLQAPLDATPRRDLHVLLMVRDDAHREALGAALEAWGMRCAAARDAEQSCELVLRSGPDPFDVAIVDAFSQSNEHAQRLLDLCALEGLALVRLLSTTDSPPVAEGELPQLYLTKPVRISELYNGIVSLLDGPPVEPILTRPDNDNVPGGAHGGALILVVDDNEINRLVAGNLLSELGYEYEMAEDGKRALEMATSGKYAAILMDCQMPEMDGYEAARRIRELSGEAAKVPIIAATAHAMAGDREKVLAAGMDDYMAKPIRARALERLLGRWVKDEPRNPRGMGARPLSEGSAASASEAVHQPWLQQPVLESPNPMSSHIVDAFLRTVPADLQAIVQGVEEGDLDAVRRAAHRLKGSCLSMGALQLAAAAGRVEHEAGDGRLDAAMASQLGPLFEQLRPQLMDKVGKAARGCP